MRSKWIDWAATPERDSRGKAVRYVGAADVHGQAIKFEVWRDLAISFPVWRFFMQGGGRMGKQGVYSYTASGSKRRASAMLRAWRAEKYLKFLGHA